MKNNHQLANVEKIVANHERIIRRLDSGIDEMKEMQWEFAKAMVKVNTELVNVNKRLDAHETKMERFMEHSERRFQVFCSRLVKLEHKNGKK